MFTESYGSWLCFALHRCEEGKGCCALRILVVELDFRNEVSFLETVIRKEVMSLSFTPNSIASSITLSTTGLLSSAILENCKYSFAGVKNTVYTAMESLSLQTIRRFADCTKRWMIAYIEGLTEGWHAYAEKQYKSHDGSMAGESDSNYLISNWHR